MNNLKPTQREIKVILSSIGLKEPFKIWNDKRVNGGRMKLWNFQMAHGDMSKMRVMLMTLFPYLEDIKVERWGYSTVVRWKEGPQRPAHYMAPFGGTYADDLPSQRHDW